MQMNTIISLFRVQFFVPYSHFAAIANGRPSFDGNSLQASSVRCPRFSDYYGSICDRHWGVYHSSVTSFCSSRRWISTTAASALICLKHMSNQTVFLNFATLWDLSNIFYAIDSGCALQLQADVTSTASGPQQTLPPRQSPRWPFRLVWSSCRLVRPSCARPSCARCRRRGARSCTRGRCPACTYLSPGEQAVDSRGIEVAMVRSDDSRRVLR